MTPTDYVPGTTADIRLINIALVGGIPVHVGAGYGVIAPSGDRLSDAGFTWQPTPDELAAATPLIQALIADLLAATGLALYTPPGPAPFVPPAA